MKVATAAHLAVPLPPETLTSDSPVPFSIKKLWYELDKFERVTFPVNAPQTDANAHPAEQVGDAILLRSDRYPAASPYNQAPYKNQKKRNLERQLDLKANGSTVRFKLKLSLGMLLLSRIFGL